MNYREALAWLYGIQRFGIKLGLENSERLFAALQVPAETARIIHVAGTNGKGSVCAMVEAICRAAGHRTGLFTSPHLVTYRERIQINRQPGTEAQVARGLTRLRDLVADWHPHPTFFELTTALALSIFKEEECEVIILETGLGGRLDATNVVMPSVAVLTPIALDHQKWLGNTLPQIAFEKAGIIKRGSPVVSAQQEPAAEKVVREIAAQREAPLTFVDAPVEDRRLGLIGRPQQENAALAITGVHAAGIEIDGPAADAALSQVQWPARFQRWSDRITIDGAHNPAAAQTLAQTWHDTFDELKATLILAVLGDKDAAGIVEALAPIAVRFILPVIRAERAIAPSELARQVSSIAPSLPHSTSTSFAAAFSEAQKFSDPILITGSLHFAGEALAHLRGEEYEECSQ